MLEKRVFPRIKLHLKIGYEFVNWKDTDLTQMENEKFTTTFDVSARGLGIEDIPELKNQHIMRKLMTGSIKFRISIYLKNNKPPIITFARLVWTDYDKNSKNQEKIKCGLNFIDISYLNFDELKNYINSHIKTTNH